MINAGIHDNDIVVVRQQETADNGDIVVAMLGDEATVKTFYHAGENGIRLQPENPHLRPIVTREAKIVGRVVLSLRQYA
jgi:repressor LexA